LRTTKWNYRWRAVSRAAAGAGLAGLAGLLLAIPSSGQQKSNKDASKTHRISAQINGEV
jgi:hypothetical protein